MKTINIYLISSLIGFLFLFSGCKTDDPALQNQPHAEVSDVSCDNYFRINDKYYPIDTASIWYFKQGNLTSFDIQLSNGKDDFLAIQYIIQKDTDVLQDGEFKYQSANDLKSFKADHFHNVLLMLGPKGEDLFLDGITGNVIENACISVKKSGTRTIIEGFLKFDSKKIQIHYVGSPELNEYW